jgi:four helix bundle protein
MLRIYSVSLDLARDAGLAAKAIARVDADLARQLRRAVVSVVLNLAEGSGSSGGNRRARYENALGSAREVAACFDVAVAMGYLGRPAEGVFGRLDQVIGTLSRLVR